MAILAGDAGLAGEPPTTPTPPIHLEFDWPGVPKRLTEFERFFLQKAFKQTSLIFTEPEPVEESVCPMPVVICDDMYPLNTYLR